MTRPVTDRAAPLQRTSDSFRFSAAVAAFGMLLRASEHAGDASFSAVHRLASGARGRDPHGYRAEFLEMVQLARKLSGGETRMVAR